MKTKASLRCCTRAPSRTIIAGANWNELASKEREEKSEEKRRKEIQCQGRQAAGEPTTERVCCSVKVMQFLSEANFTLCTKKKSYFKSNNQIFEADGPAHERRRCHLCRYLNSSDWVQIELTRYDHVCESSTARILQIFWSFHSRVNFLLKWVMRTRTLFNRLGPAIR